ncbi:kinase domain protein [Ceratobasidium sp. AG-Ba]|nr:kinase domain protein [Ceratobasidium sp. AG-Ba]QRW11090.1 kinase domain protein [Ceratobasidium sp. AG-Ba]
MSDDKIILNILLEGDDPYEDLFQIHTLRSATFSSLKGEISAAYNRITGTSILKLKLYSCNVLREEIGGFQPSSKTFLDLVEEVGSVWSAGSSINKRMIHIFVEYKVLSRPHLVSRKDAEEPTAAPVDPIQDLVDKLTQTQLDFIQSLAIHSSARAAEIQNFRKQQETAYYIMNGRPASRDGPPIVLYHPVFGEFLSNLRSEDPLPPEVSYLVTSYFSRSQMIYETELRDPPDQSGQHQAQNVARDQSCREPLSALLGSLLSRSPAHGAQPDGLVTSSVGACIILLELKNEIGTGGSDPSIQAAQSYSRYWGGFQARKLFFKCCCPSILIAIAGPWMVILGAVFLDRPVVQPLTHFLWTGNDPSRPLELDYLARVFRSVHLARTKLEEYYSTLSEVATNPGRFFPYITHFTDPHDRRVDFTYLKPLYQDYPARDKLLFLAETRTEDGPKQIVVKFVKTYNAIAHRKLAERFLAPALLYDGTAHRQDQPGPDFSMVVMDFVPGVDLSKFTVYPLPSFVSKKLTEALECLHADNIVFGDLRGPNVMIENDSSGRPIGVKLVDFDWCGIHQEGKYPLSMNAEIDWASGMGPGMLMDKSHDIGMKEKLQLIL